jgi:hypothetical protein
MVGFGRRSKRWSQNEGLAFALALDRLDFTDWQRQAFDDGEKTILEVLDVALLR